MSDQVILKQYSVYNAKLILSINITAFRKLSLAMSQIKFLLNHVNYIKCDIYLFYVLYICMTIWTNPRNKLLHEKSSKSHIRETQNLSTCVDSSIITNDEYQYLEFGPPRG